MHQVLVVLQEILCAGKEVDDAVVPTVIQIKEASAAKDFQPGCMAVYDRPVSLM